MFRKAQTTVSLRVELQPFLLEYANLLDRNPSAVLNDLFQGVVNTIEEDEPNHAIEILDALRRSKGKDINIKLSEKYYRAVFGTAEPSAEAAAAKQLALDNTGRVVSPLKEAKVAGLPYEGDAGARVKVFGLLTSVLTEEIGTLYGSALMAEAAKEIYDPRKITSQNYFLRMVKTAAVFNEVYQLFLHDHLARAIVREIPKRFLPD